MKKPLTERLQSQIAGARAEQAEAEAFRAQLIAELVDAKPAELNAKHEALKAIDVEIAAAKAKVRNLEDALRVAEQRDSDAGKAEALALLQAQRALVDELNAAMADDFRALIAGIEALHPIVARIEARGNDRASAAYSVIRACAPDRVLKVYDPLANVLRGDIPALRGIVADTLFATGLGRVAVHCYPMIEIQPARVDVPLESVIAKTEHNICVTLDRLMREHTSPVQA